jgi:hypothetical protein
MISQTKYAELQFGHKTISQITTHLLTVHNAQHAKPAATLDLSG